jgi:drug/metabolite transporter (DMT)-like permease
VTLLYTALALSAFAANSLLCRLALGGGLIDAASFTSIRIVSGAAMLVAISTTIGARRSGAPAVSALPSSPGRSSSAGLARWRSAFALFVYAIAFSFAYLNLTVGTGALILFGAVQATMISAALVTGERPRPLEWIGLASAGFGLLVLVAPGLTAPPLAGSLAMAIAGTAWGFYSLWGRRIQNPLGATTTNFVRAVPLSLLASLAAIGSRHATTEGVLLSASSGALASGLGYVVWYAAISGLTATRAATVQIAVPVLAAAGGVVLLSEPITLRLIAGAVLILGGIGLGVASRK